ncbi:hypothetical protein [Chryseobacterium ginsengisoli]
MENILENKDLINSYLNLSVLQQFNINIDLKDEYVFTENLVSKKPIIATTFTDRIISYPMIKLFLTALITDINNGNCTIEFIKKRLKYSKESDSQEMEEIA